MKTDMNTVVANEAGEERLTWHQPEIKRLNVSMDTANGAGNGEDAGTASDSPQFGS